MKTLEIVVKEWNIFKTWFMHVPGFTMELAQHGDAVLIRVKELCGPKDPEANTTPLSEKGGKLLKELDAYLGQQDELFASHLWP